MGWMTNVKARDILFLPVYLVMAPLIIAGGAVAPLVNRAHCAIKGHTQTGVNYPCARCNHFALPERSLTAILDDIFSEEFLDDTCTTMYDGRTVDVVRDRHEVNELIHALRKGPYTEDIVEHYLNQLFVKKPLALGVGYDIEGLAALLFSMECAEVSYLTNIVKPFAESQAAELRWLPSYAKRILVRAKRRANDVES